MDDLILCIKRARDGTRILGVFTNTSKKEVCRTVIFICTRFVPLFINLFCTETLKFSL